MLKFWSVINCFFMHWMKKLTLETNFIQVLRVKALFKAEQYCSWSIGFIYWKKYSVIFDIFIHTSYLFSFIIFWIYWIFQDWEFKTTRMEYWISPEIVVKFFTLFLFIFFLISYRTYYLGEWKNIENCTKIWELELFLIHEFCVRNQTRLNKSDPESSNQMVLHS